MSDPTLPTAPSPGAAFSWAWRCFRSNAGPFVALAAVVTILQFLQLIASQPLQNVTVDCLDPQTSGQQQACQESLGGVVAPVLLGLLFWAISLLATVGVQRAALRATLGGTPSFADMLTTRYLLRYVLFTLVYVVLVVVGMVMCIVPGLLILFFLQLGPYAVLDTGAGVREAIRRSTIAMRANPGPGLLLLLVNVAAVLLGSTFYGLPTLVTLPLATLFTAHLYRQFNREQVADVR